MYVCMYVQHINKSNSQNHLFFFLIDFLFSNFLLLEIQCEGSIIRFSFVVE